MRLPSLRVRVALVLTAMLMGVAGVLQLPQPVPADTATAFSPAAEQSLELSGPEPVPLAPVTPSPPPPPTPAPPAAAEVPLAERLAGLVADPELAGAGLGVRVEDASGNILFDHHGAQPLLPASTQKLVVAAAALAGLGPDHRYVTTVRSSAAPDADGTVHGDLALVGSGDPALATPTYANEVWPERPHTSLSSLADAVVAAGVRRVTGGVLGDPSVFPDEPVAAGWLPRYFEELDATLVSGLTVDAGRRLFVRNGRLDAEPSPDPASEAAAALYTLLQARGVVIEGGVGAVRGAATGVEIAAVTSPPMGELVRHLVQRSDNHMAEAVFRTVGLVVAGDASWAGAAHATRQVLEPVGLDWSGTVLADGSGLSREDRLSPALLVALDRAMAASRLGGIWDASMAVAGESGTLRRRLLGTFADRHLRGKTGSLEDVRALSGSVTSPSGDRLYFAVLVNDLARNQRNAARRLQDGLALALAESARGCGQHRLPDASMQLVCP